MQYGGGGHRFMKLFHKIPLFFWTMASLKEQTLAVASQEEVGRAATKRNQKEIVP